MNSEFFGLVDRNIYNQYPTPLELKKGLICNDIDRSYAPGLVLDEESWFIVPTEDSITKVNQPLKDFDLLKEFANTQRTPEAFLQFANRFGPLNAQPDSVVKGMASYTQSYTLWNLMHLNICDALDLLEILSYGKDEIASWSIFRLKSRGETIYRGPGGNLPMNNQEIDRIIAERFEGSQESIFLSYAKIFLHFIMQIHMGQFKVFPTPIIESGNIEPYFRPDSGFALLWYSIFQAATGAKKYARCTICGEWEDITKAGNKKWKRHPACYNRQNSIRNAKISRAQKMLIKGASVEDVAAKIDESPETLIKWLDQKQEDASIWQKRQSRLKEEYDNNAYCRRVKNNTNTIDP